MLLPFEVLYEDNVIISYIVSIACHKLTVGACGQKVNCLFIWVVDASVVGAYTPTLHSSVIIRPDLDQYSTFPLYRISLQCSFGQRVRVNPFYSFLFDFRQSWRFRWGRPPYHTVVGRSQDDKRGALIGIDLTAFSQKGTVHLSPTFELVSERPCSVFLERKTRLSCGWDVG